MRTLRHADLNYPYREIIELKKHTRELKSTNLNYLSRKVKCKRCAI